MTLARRGHSLAVYDLRSNAAFGLEGVPAVLASPREVADVASTIFLCVVDAQQIQEVLEGPDGLLAGLRADTSLVVMSTISLQDLRVLRDFAAGFGISVLDAGVTGGPAAAASGDLVVFLGGEDLVVQEQLAVVEDCCGMVVHVGGPGSGMAAKIARNVISYGSFRAAYEGALLAEHSGVDLHQFAAAIRASDQLSGGHTLFFDRRGTVVPIDPIAALDAGLMDSAMHMDRLAAKDLAAAIELAHELGLTLPLAEVTAAHYPAVVGLAATTLSCVNAVAPSKPT